MKKNSFDNRLQNDLFPDMPASFERGLKKAMEQAGVKPRKRATATGIFTGVSWGEAKARQTRLHQA